MAKGEMLSLGALVATLELLVRILMEALTPEQRSDLIKKSNRGRLR